MDQQKPYKIVLAGGPGSGKTTLIEILKEKNLLCFEEISRDFIELGKAQGKKNFFEEDPMVFSNFLWKGRIEQYRNSETKTDKYAFFDRGIHEVYAYLKYIKHPFPYFKKEAEKYPYDIVFLVPPIKSIFKQDAQRMETFEKAVLIHQFIEKTYKSTHKRIIEVPWDTPQNRIEFILNKCDDVFGQ